MAVTTVPNWTPMTDLDSSIRRWRHEEYDVWMTVSHQPDHYAQDDESHAHDGEDGPEQVMRWHARVTLGKNITVGVNEIAICRDACGDAESEVMDWARNWMTGEFEAWVATLDDADDWRLD